MYVYTLLGLQRENNTNANNDDHKQGGLLNKVVTRLVSEPRCNKLHNTAHTAASSHWTTRLASPHILVCAVYISGRRKKIPALLIIRQW